MRREARDLFASVNLHAGDSILNRSQAHSTSVEAIELAFGEGVSRGNWHKRHCESSLRFLLLLVCIHAAHA
jgi:hypothetical protein